MVIVGASGVVAGVASLLALEAVPVPIAFTAETRKIYFVPFVSPVTTTVVASDSSSVNVVHEFGVLARAYSMI